MKEPGRFFNSDRFQVSRTIRRQFADLFSLVFVLLLVMAGSPVSSMAEDIPVKTRQKPVRVTKTKKLPADIVREKGKIHDKSKRLGTATDLWAVQLKPDTTPQQIARLTGADYVGPVEGIDDTFLFRFKDKKTDGKAISVDNKLESIPEILWFEQQFQKRKSLRSFAEIADGRLKDQWHLENTGQKHGVPGQDANVFPAWAKGYSGEGVVIAIVDSGVDYTHPDLAPNYLSNIDRDLAGNDFNPFPASFTETHGTSVAGVAAARDEGTGVVGSAYRSKFTNLRYIVEDYGPTDSEEQIVFNHQNQTIDIYNHSWGPGEDVIDNTVYTPFDGPGPLSEAAIIAAVNAGRDGKGCIILFAAGNGLETGSNVNYNGYANSRYTIAVGAMGNQGYQSSYSEPGAAMLVTAPSSGNRGGIVTTNYSAQPSGNITESFGGTSSATPLVSGIVALMLEANPDLTWRDVQHILVESAVQVDPDDADWISNGAGYRVNHKYGHGKVDALGAVSLAETWPGVADEYQLSSITRSVGAYIPIYSNTGRSSSINMSPTTDLHIEHITITVTLNHSDWGQLEIELVSPSGVSSILAEPHNSYNDPTTWDFDTVRHWGESTAGNWTLIVRNPSGSTNGTFTSWKLTFHGTQVVPGENRKPVVNNESVISVTGDTSLNVLDNDSDPDGDPLKLISVYQPAHGTVTFSENGFLKYSQNRKYSGIERIEYTVEDGKMGVNHGFVYIELDAPAAHDDFYAIKTNSSTTFDVLDNDYDYLNGEIAIIRVGQTENAELAINENAITYQADTSFFGNDKFTYMIEDEDGLRDTAQVIVTIPRNGDFALNFDGENDQVLIQSNQMPNITAAITVEAWIKPLGWGEAATGFGRIIDKENYLLFLNSEGHLSEDYLGNNILGYKNHSMVFVMDHSNGSISYSNTAENSISLNVWQHVAVTYNGSGQIRFYVNGNLVSHTYLTTQEGLNSPTGQIADNSNYDMRIGESSNQLRTFEGYIDEVRLWNRVLSQSEIMSRMNSALSGTESGLVGYWPMREGQGLILNDESTWNGYGTISGAYWVKGKTGINDNPVFNQDVIKTVKNTPVSLNIFENDTDADFDILELLDVIPQSNLYVDYDSSGNIILKPYGDFLGEISLSYLASDGFNAPQTQILQLNVLEGINYEAWRLARFAYSALPSQPEDDADQDGRSNYREYVFASDPLVVEAGATQSVIIPIGGNQFSLQLQRPIDAIDLVYRLEYSTDLIQWTEAVENTDYTITSTIDRGDETEIVTYELNAPVDGNYFVRIAAENSP